MNAQNLKNYIIDNDKLQDILEELGCHHIDTHDNNRYITCAFPDGDNTKGIVIYTDNLFVDCNTRDIEDKYGNSDIISLVCFIKDFYFSHAIKWMCDTLGLDNYSDENEEMPMSLQIIQMLKDLKSGLDFDEEKERLKPINERILTYYYPYVNDKFLADGVSYHTQREFEIGYDLGSQRYTIPIRDELGTLVGVKGRTQLEDGSVEKYLYLAKCAKSKVLYGLNKTMPYIVEKSEVIVVESEKSVLALWSQGIRNAVAIGCHKISKTQVEKITRIGIKEVILCYDSDVARKDNGMIDKSMYLKEANKFMDSVKVSAMVDLKGEYLKEKESPVDNMEMFYKLYKERKVLQRGR